MVVVQKKDYFFIESQKWCFDTMSNVMERIFLYIHSTHAYCLYTIKLERYAPYNSLLHILCLSINNFTQLLLYFYHIYYTFYIYMKNIIIPIEMLLCFFCFVFKTRIHRNLSRCYFLNEYLGIVLLGFIHCSCGFRLIVLTRFGLE